MTKVLSVSPATVDVLRKPIRGRGGFQSLMRRIRLGLHGSRLTVTEDDLDALLRATRGPVGGFQRRAREILFDAILAELESQTPARRSKRRATLLAFEQPSGRQRSLPLGERPNGGRA